MTGTEHDPAPLGLRLLLLSALIVLAGIVLVVSGHLDQPDRIDPRALVALVTRG